MPTKFILDPSPLIVLSLLPLFRSFSSFQMVVGKFISLNVRGISNFCKRRTIFTWCRKQKVDVIFDCTVEEIVTDADGRYIMLKVLLKGEQTI